MAPPLLALRGASLRIGRQQLFDGIDATVARGDRICLVGRNGSGKSTLLKVLAGLVDLDAGERFEQPRTHVTYLQQDPAPPTAQTLAAHVQDALPPSERSEVARLRAELILQELGMDPERPPERLSGGEMRRVSLAAAVVGEPDVLLLDEPTNHLDLPAIEWLEERLAAFSGSFVVISHDRRFLARLSTKTWWLDRGRLHATEQGFAAFDDWSQTILDAEEAELTRLDKKLEAEMHWLHRGVTARRKRNMGRLRALEQLRIQRREIVGVQGSAKMSATGGQLGGRLVVEAEHISKSFGGRTIIGDFGTRILRGDRIGVIGPNGAGKSTLLGLLTGEIEPDSGTVRLGTSLQIARFDQHRAQLDPDRTPWETLCPAGGDTVEVQGRRRHVVGYLRDFLFRDEQARQPVRSLSGGERNRLLLAFILARPANLLVLDEPTNDLDMDTLDLLEDTLADYDGTLLLVSHDRDFLDRLVTSTIAFEGEGLLREYAGGYSDYERQRPARPSAEVRAKAVAAPVRPARQPRGFDAKLQRELDRLPARIDRVQAEIHRIEAALSDPSLFSTDPARFEALTEALAAQQADLGALEERWLELESQRETALGS